MSLFGIERFRPEGYQPEKSRIVGTPTTPKGGTAVVSPAVRGTLIVGEPAPRSYVAKCQYCGRYGDLGSCAGCGAPNLPHTSMQRIEVTHLRSPQGEPEFVEAFPDPQPIVIQR